MRIAGYEIGHGRRPMVVAEIGAAHNGRLDTTLDLIRLAKATGADAVKIQCLLPDTITRNFDRPEFVIDKGPWKGHRLFDLYTITHMPRAWFPVLFAQAADIGMPLFPSVFSIEDLEFVSQFSPPAYKISSFELVDIGLIRAALMKHVPLILSTGMADQTDINQAMYASASARSIWLHCVSSYPTKVEGSNLRWMDVLRRNQDFVGLSDHTLGFEVAQMATARGACLIEKHITLTPGGDGPDDGFATGPEDFAKFVQAVHRAYAALGDGDPLRARDDSEHRSLRKSLYVVKPIAEGDMITVDNVASIRPGLGLAPRLFADAMGRKALMDLPEGTPLALHMVEGMMEKHGR